jgi:hypothetical protein
MDRRLEGDTRGPTVPQANPRPPKAPQAAKGYVSSHQPAPAANFCFFH